MLRLMMITLYPLLSVILQQAEWISVVNTLGFPVAITLFLVFFMFKVVWPWMTGTMEQYIEQNKQLNTSYITGLKEITSSYNTLVKEVRDESREREKLQREENLRREKEYRDLLQKQAEQNLTALEAINANTVAMQSLGSAVEKLREAAKLEERLAELEEKYKNR